MVFCYLIKQSQGFETVAAATKVSKQMSLEKVHYMLGHTNHRLTIDMAKHLGWGQLKNSGKICQSCAEAKVKQKAVSHTRREPKSIIPNTRMYHDLATVKAPADVAEKLLKPNWQPFVNEATGMKVSSFRKNKDGILEDTSARLKAMERLADKKIWILRQSICR